MGDIKKEDAIGVFDSGVGGLTVLKELVKYIASLRLRAEDRVSPSPARRVQRFCRAGRVRRSRWQPSSRQGLWTDETAAVARRLVRRQNHLMYIAAPWQALALYPTLDSCLHQR